jgi:hypothetical protein
MADRIRGCPVVIGHPPEGALNGTEFIRRVIGAVIYGYVRDDNLMCVARILDANAAEILASGEFDTSPCVTFDANENATIEVNGLPMTVEGTCRLIDHIAVLPPQGGVWSKGGRADPGVVSQGE